MNTHLLKRLAAENIENMTLDQFCESLGIDVDDLSEKINDIIPDFFNPRNKTFVKVLNDIYKLCLIHFKGDTTQTKQKCLNTCTLKYLFQYRRLDIDTQLEFLNELMFVLNDQYVLNDPKCFLVNQLRSFIIFNDDISIEAYVEEMIDNIDIKQQDITAIQEAYENADDQTKTLVDTSIDNILNNREIPLATTFEIMRQKLNLDQTIVDDISNLTFGDVEENETNTDEQMDQSNEQSVEQEINQEDVNQEVKEENIPDTASELFDGNENVHKINGKYKINNIRFQELALAYTDNQLNDALERLLPELFPSDMIYEIANNLFKALYKKVKAALSKEQLENKFKNFAKQGYMLLNIYIKSKYKDTIVPTQLVKNYLQLLDADLAKQVVFSTGSDFITTFTHYIVQSSHADLYKSIAESRIEEFIQNNNLVELYNLANDIKPDDISSENDITEQSNNRSETPNSENNSSQEQSTDTQSTDISSNDIKSNDDPSVDNSTTSDETPKKSKKKKTVENISNQDITYLFNIINDPDKVNNAIINYIKTLFTEDNMTKYIDTIFMLLFKNIQKYRRGLSSERINDYIFLQCIGNVSRLIDTLLSYTSTPNKLSTQQFKQLLIDIDPDLIKNYKYKSDSKLVKTCFTYIKDNHTIYNKFIQAQWKDYFTNHDVKSMYQDFVLQHLDGTNQETIVEPDLGQDYIDKVNKVYRTNQQNKNDRSDKNDQQDKTNQINKKDQAEEVKPIKSENKSKPKTEEQVIDDLVQSTKSDTNKLICDLSTFKSFADTVANHYSITPNKVLEDTINIAKRTIDDADIINDKNVREKLNNLLNFSRNINLGNTLLNNVINHFSDNKLNLAMPAIDSRFAKSLFQTISTNKNFAIYLRNKINQLFKGTPKEISKDVSKNSLEDNKSVQKSNKDLSWQEIKQLPTVDKASGVNDSVKDDVNFNIAGFFDNEKMIVLRDDVLTAPSGMSYQNMLNDYVKNNPNVSIEAYATGILSNNCAFITSYGKLDKLEVIRTIKEYCPVSKIYFKQGNRNLMLIMERIARKNNKCI